MASVLRGMASILRPRPVLGHPFRLFCTALKTIAFAHLFYEYGYTLAPAHGPSMLPTFELVGEWILVSKRHRHGRGVQVGDLVAYKIPISPDSDGVKRVLGLPGDYVMIDSPDSGSDAMIQVPPGHCWIVGDNLPASRDSRVFGPLPLALVRGKVIAVHRQSRPPWDFKWIENPLTSYPSPPQS